MGGLAARGAGMRRGFVFTTDAALALTWTLALVASSIWLVEDADRNRWDDAVSARYAYDTGLALDRSGAISSENDTMVEALLNATRQKNRMVGIDAYKYAYYNGTLVQAGKRHYGDAVDGDMTRQRVLSARKNLVFVIDVEVGPR
jgi:hypothetical protein